MRTTQHTPARTFAPLPPDTLRAYVVRAVNLKWQAKTLIDGEVVAEHDERAAVLHEVRERGYFLTN